MTRLTGAALVVLLAGGPAAADQAVIRTAERPVGGSIREVPPADAAARRSASTLRFEPRPDDVTQAQPFARTGTFRGGVAVWWWPYPVAVTPPAPRIVAPVVPAGSGPAGGLQLDVQPWRAQVWVDGVYAGLVEEFRGYYRHLALSAGPHVVAIVADGYEPLVLEVVIAPGQTLTYRAALAYSPR